MKPTHPIVISASRRSDIPAFYMDWFMGRIAKGVFELVNPYNRTKKVVAAGPSDVHSIVFWSKNFGPFLEGGFGQRLNDLGYQLFFNFTVNSSDARLEPNLPPLRDRLEQLDRLSRLFSAKAVNWRFDPICFYTPPKGGPTNNLADFETIAQAAAGCGVTRCITSFMDHYPKIEKRIKTIPGFHFNDPSNNQKQTILLKMEKYVRDLGIDLYTCCEKDVLGVLPAGTTIKPSACIDHGLLVDLYGGRLSRKKDAGQRRSAGCGCDASLDVGIYHKHPCPHSCLFCYANPVLLQLSG